MIDISLGQCHSKLDGENHVLFEDLKRDWQTGASAWNTAYQTGRKRLSRGKAGINSKPVN
jgi:hypothetical protein